MSVLFILYERRFGACHTKSTYYKPDYAKYGRFRLLHGSHILKKHEMPTFM